LGSSYNTHLYKTLRLERRLVRTSQPASTEVAGACDHSRKAFLVLAEFID
jgi:hypothetical protein